MSTADENIEPSDRTPSLNYSTPQATDAPSERLSRGDVACIAVKIVGLYSIVLALPALATFLRYLGSDLVSILTAAIPFLIYGAVGVSLLIYGGKVSHWLLPRTAVLTVQPPGPAPAQIQAIAFSIIGLLFLVWSVPTLAWLFVMVARGEGRSIQLTVNTRLTAEIPQLVYYSVEAILGVWLFFGSKRLSTWWWSLRHTEFSPAEYRSGHDVPKVNE